MCVRKWIKPTKQDGILAVALLAVALLSLGLFWLFRPRSDVPLVAQITVDNVTIEALPLHMDKTVVLPTGHVVKVENGEISVISAPCPDHICMDTPPAHAPGSCIVCLPERLIITVTEEQDG